MRYSLIFAGVMGAVLAANPVAMVDLVQKPHFALAGGPALAPLALGHVAFAMFTIACTILNGAGKTRDAIVVCAVTLALLGVGLWLAIPRFEPGPDMLLACGTATASAMLLGALASGWLVLRRFGAVIPPATVVRVLIALGACLGVGRAVPARSPLMTLAMAAGTAVLFFLILALTRELGRADLDALKTIVRRRS
jgi:O-antigen/teichoic acid export membrane protein